MKKLSILFALVFVLMSGCSERSPEADAGLNIGGSQNPDPSPDPDPDPDPDPQPQNSTSVVVITDNSVIETGGSEIAKITALVKDKDNVLVEGTAISFASTGGSLRVQSDTTAEDGTATAELGVEGDPMNQAITVSATADGVTSSVTVQAAGTQIALSGPTAMVAGDDAQLIGTLTAGNGEPITNEVMTFTSDNGNAITPDNAVTDENGQVEVSISSTAGSDTITASALSGNVTAGYALNVADDLLSFVTPSSGKELVVGTDHTVQVKWVSNGAAVVGQNLVFGVTAGQIVGASTVATDVNGVASIQISSVSAGVATITVGGTGAGDPATQLDVEFVAVNPNSISLNAAPNVVATKGKSVITATVLDPNANPVKGKTVKFESAEAFGGTMPPSAVTDSNGEAIITFTAGSLPTETNELVITATVAENPSIANSVALTVNKQELHVVIGGASEVAENSNKTQYLQSFVVQVADGSGLPVKDATVKVSIDALNYYKGQYLLNDVEDAWVQHIYSYCHAEDNAGAFDTDPLLASVADFPALSGNGNGQLEPYEDYNGNGVLDPQNPATITADTVAPTIQSGSITTDENGFGYFVLAYPKSNAAWARLAIVASATAQNVEAKAIFESHMPVDAEEIDDENSTMPNHTSPYGVAVQNCKNLD